MSDWEPAVKALSTGVIYMSQVPPQAGESAGRQRAARYAQA